jgi:hypothetical protein
MAHFTDNVDGATAELVDDGYWSSDHPLHGLALDGVSCTLCHQIEATRGAGEGRIFSGNYGIDTELLAGERLNYGPFPVSEENARLMQMASGYVPQESRHIKQALICATCHTLYTPYLDSAGEIAGEFPEQTPFLEWRVSDYHQVKSCQGCHMPAAQGGVVLSTTGGEPQQPFSQHSFVGGNVLMLQILQRFPEENQVTAATEHFTATIDRVKDQIENYTASISISDLLLDREILTADVRIVSRVGHKFPTGFPSRRAWIHVWVTDGSGQVIFESGSFDDDGAIIGNDNDADPALFEPHYALVEQPDQVQIYEAIMGDTENEVTTTLLRGAGYLKDNRLLPAGFDKDGQMADIAVYGEALDDDNFVGSGDQIRYRIHVGDSEGPYTVYAELCYQAIGYRWVQNLDENPSEEATLFMSALATVPNTPLIVASTTQEVQ